MLAPTAAAVGAPAEWPIPGTIEAFSRSMMTSPSRSPAGLGFMRPFQAATLVNEMSALANVVMGGYSRLHRSTLRYRLQRLREISGLDLADPDTRFNLQLATRAWATLGAIGDP